MDMVYMSPSPHHDAFDEVMDIRKCDFSKHPTAGMSLIEQNGRRLILAHMTPSTPGAKVPRWRTWLRGAWLIKIAGTSVTMIDDARNVFESLSNSGATLAHLLFAHPDVRPDISCRGLPIISSEPFATHAQLNDRWEFSMVALHLSKKPTYDLIDSWEVLNVVTRVMRLTRGKLLKQHDWEEWQESKFLQLDQYDTQGMFGLPVMIDQMRLYSIRCGHMLSKRWMVERRQGGHVKVHPVRARQKCWAKHMPIVSTRQACNYFMQSLQWKIC